MKPPAGIKFCPGSLACSPGRMKGTWANSLQGCFRIQGTGFNRGAGSPVTLVKQVAYLVLSPEGSQCVVEAGLAQA